MADRGRLSALAAKACMLNNYVAGLGQIAWIMRYLEKTSREESSTDFVISAEHYLDYRDMNTKLFIGNLSFKLTEPELEKLFSAAGTVVSVAIPVDRVSGNKRGFAFVEMSTQAEAEAAVKQFNGQTVDGRQIAVNPSQPRDAGAPRRNNRNS